MLRSIIMASAILAITFPAQAAEKWGIEHEKVVRIEAKVVDIACELSGDCPTNCGEGRRHLGLLQNDGRLILVAKNQDIFAGGTADLLPFCGKKIIADGLLIENPKMPLFVLQFKRSAPDGKWSRANWFSKAWAKKYPGQNADQWFRHDPLINQTIAKDGVFGIPGLKPADE